MPSPQIETSELTVEFAGKMVLNKISLTLAPGSITGILGPSGCGKSTLLRCLAGTQAPSSGQIRFQPPLFKLAYVFQDATLLPWRTVEENLQLPFELRGESFSGIDKELERVKLLGAKKLYPHQLSGGMKMRASLARALVEKPDVLLLDEPLAALDEVTRQTLQEEIHRLWVQLGMTIVFVTHSISEAVFLSERVLLITPVNSQAKGQIICDKPIDLEIERTSERTNSLRWDPRYIQLCSELTQHFRGIQQ